MPLQAGMGFFMDSRLLSTGEIYFFRNPSPTFAISIKNQLHEGVRNKES